MPWIREHDDRWSFILPYVLLSVILSVAISLFWLLALIVVHVLLEWMRHRALPRGARFLHALARTQLDWALLTAAICMEVYLDTVAGLAGAGQFARGMGRLLTRLPGWQHTLRAIMLSSDDALQLLKLRKSSPDTDKTPLQFEKVASIIFIIAMALLAIAPVLLPIDFPDMPRMVAAAFRPWP